MTEAATMGNIRTKKIIRKEDFQCLSRIIN